MEGGDFLSFIHHRNASQQFLKNALVKELEVTTTPVEVKVGTDILYGRKRIYVLNDSSNVVYMGGSDDFVVGEDITMTIYSGQVYFFDVNPNPRPDEAFRLFLAIGDGYTSTTVKIWEVE